MVYLFGFFCVYCNAPIQIYVVNRFSHGVLHLGVYSVTSWHQFELYLQQVSWPKCFDLRPIERDLPLEHSLIHILKYIKMKIYALDMLSNLLYILSLSYLRQRLWNIYFDSLEWKSKIYLPTFTLTMEASKHKFYILLDLLLDDHKFILKNKS